MDSDDDISEGEILSDDGELTNNPDDEYEDGMLWMTKKAKLTRRKVINPISQT